jgi:predicted metal-dependent phosphoesterase TrpH
MEGYLSAANLELPDSLELIPGVEISALWDTKEVHVVGLFVSPSHPGLNSLLTDQQERRWQRLMEFDRKLVKAGISGLDQYRGDRKGQALEVAEGKGSRIHRLPISRGGFERMKGAHHGGYIRDLL